MVELADRQRDHVLGAGLGAGQSDRAELDVGAELEDVDPEAHAGGRAGERLARKVAGPCHVERLGAVGGHGEHVVQVGP
ncbi:hypothetical protein HFP15_41370 [Amycolatopsis sp. K13G38]|uniref:Uncharacterized protein n=1 Tax=Amycolatopsis acididurans TaxID=2724524 RepID=A0ABX1JHN0_9PSEU|nr:hypothetical protein [Amycolatopsis acididurans]NKQ59307.1 hypothetical protein [Amycolatopsis acididurans]